MSDSDQNKPAAGDPRRYSSIVVDGVKQAPSRAMLRAVGFTDADFTQDPGRHRLDLEHGHALQHAHRRTGRVKRQRARMRPAARPCIFNTITVSDGISMGTPGMRYSLVSREVIADSIETVVGRRGLRRLRGHRRLRQEHARLRDGHGAPEPAVGVRLRRHHPAGRQAPATSSPSSKPSAGVASGRVSATNCCWKSSERAIPGPGSCGGMYTANTMASAIEAMGMSLPNSSRAGSRFRSTSARTAATPVPRSSN